MLATRPIPAARSALAPRALALALVGACAAFCLSLVTGAWQSGVRWFVVETPSMAVAAPVGALVITAPLRQPAQVGQIVAFLPPGHDRTYTHRVVAVDPAGAVSTRGDLNDAQDPWTVPADRIDGRAIAVVPTAGYWLRGFPMALVGLFAVLLATSPVGRSDLRSALRFMGGHVVIALVLLWLKPFASVVVVTSTAVAAGVRVAVVGTGILPARLVSLTTGRALAHVEVGRISTFRAAAHESGRNAAVVTIDPDAGQIVGLLLVACLPAVLFLAVGIPRRGDG